MRARGWHWPTGQDGIRHVVMRRHWSPCHAAADTQPLWQGGLQGWVCGSRSRAASPPPPPPLLAQVLLQEALSCAQLERRSDGQWR